MLPFAGIPRFREGDQRFLRVRPDFKFPVITLTEDEVLGLSLATVMTNARGLDVSKGRWSWTERRSRRCKRMGRLILGPGRYVAVDRSLRAFEFARQRIGIPQTLSIAGLPGSTMSAPDLLHPAGIPFPRGDGRLTAAIPAGIAGHCPDPLAGET